MPSQGPRNGTSASGTNWVNPTNALAADGVVTSNPGPNNDWLLVQGLGFSIPGTATVVGVQVGSVLVDFPSLADTTKMASTRSDTFADQVGH
jgi:hypothetical protein